MRPIVGLGIRPPSVDVHPSLTSNRPSRSAQIGSPWNPLDPRVVFRDSGVTGLEMYRELSPRASFDPLCIRIRGTTFPRLKSRVRSPSPAHRLPLSTVSRSSPTRGQIPRRNALWGSRHGQRGAAWATWRGARGFQAGDLSAVRHGVGCQHQVLNEQEGLAR